MTSPGGLWTKTVRVHSAREILRRIPDQGVCPVTGKVRYRNRRLATQALAAARKLPDWSGAGSTYRCAHCPSHHFTHLPDDDTGEAA